jgi:hypothetical protein
VNHYVLNREACNREKFILQYCTNKSVLHSGRADYPYTEERIKNRAWLHSKLTESYLYRIVNKNPVVPYLVERLATIITPNWGKGIVHVYSAQSGQ